MPYTIITRKQFDTTGPRPLDHPADTERAVATLDEARKGAWGPRDWRGTCEAIGESGGTIGPLPDGTVIEVRKVSWSWLEDYVDHDEATAIHERGPLREAGPYTAAIVDAFNAR